MLVDPPDEMPLGRLTTDAGAIRAGVQLGLEVGRRLALQLLPSEGARAST
jgi:hypothetical protein